jgi:hypothetical protein|tara:strand:- start:32 stop:412 length:381 start_codon:yes stop_codon:yes gene_type:complete
MSTKWIYTFNEYTSQSDLDAAVLAQKVRLDSNPTDWVEVKKATGNDTDGWVLSPTLLTDAEINNLDAAKYYSVSAIASGDNALGLTSPEADAKVRELRTAYAQGMQVNTVYVVDAPTSEDMSAYVA